MKKVLVLGAGLVCRPLVRYLLEQCGFQVTVAENGQIACDKALAAINE